MSNAIPYQFDAIDASEVLAGFARALGTESKAEPLTGAAEEFRNGIWRNFIATEGPDGTTWPPRKDNLPHPLLFKTGQMLEAAIGEGGGAVTEIGPHDALLEVSDSAVPHAKWQQYGTKNKDGSQRIPPRPYYYAGSTTLDAMTDRMATETMRMLLP